MRSDMSRLAGGEMGGADREGGADVCTYRVLHVEPDCREGDGHASARANEGVSAQLDIHAHPLGYACVMKTTAEGSALIFELQGRAELRHFLLSYLDVRMAEGLECILDNSLMTEILAGPEASEEPVPTDDEANSMQRTFRDGRDLGEAHVGGEARREEEGEPNGRQRANHMSILYEGPIGAKDWSNGDPEGLQGSSHTDYGSGQGIVSFDIDSALDTPASPGCTSQRYDAKMKMVSNYFYLPINEASEMLNICPTVLKKICRRNGVARWPFRKLKSIGKLTEKIKESIEKSEAGSGWEPNTVSQQLRCELEFLDREKRSILGHS